MDKNHSSKFLPTAILKFNTTNITGGNGNKSLNDITGLNLNFLNSNKATSNNNNNNTNTNNSNNNNKPHQFELTTSTAPRFFASCIQTESILKCNISLSGSKFQVLSNGSIVIVSKIGLHFHYKDGSNSALHGTIKILMSKDLRIEWVDLNFSDYQSNISVLALEEKLKSIITDNTSITKKDIKRQKELLDELVKILKHQNYN